MFTTHGTLVAAAYNATCTLCNVVIHHSNWHPHGSERSEFFFDPEQSPYFVITNQTTIEVKLLEQLTHQIVHSGVTFESQALVYNASFGAHDQRRLASLRDVFS